MSEKPPIWNNDYGEFQCPVCGFIDIEYAPIDNSWNCDCGYEYFE